MMKNSTLLSFSSAAVAGLTLLASPLAFGDEVTVTPGTPTVIEKNTVSPPVVVEKPVIVEKQAPPVVVEKVTPAPAPVIQEKTTTTTTTSNR